MDTMNQPPEPQKPWKTAQSPQSRSLFMNLPLDVLKAIADYLPPACAAALSLTCQAALAVFKPQSPLCDCQLTVFRRQLERDLSESRFFCWDCKQLHRYSKGWRVRSDRPEGLRWVPCQRRSSFERRGPWFFRFQHFQLVMNEHYYGPGRGLPAASLLEPARFGPWDSQPTLAVLDGQCFLSVQYDVFLGGTRAANTAALGGYSPALLFCQHLETAPQVWDVTRGGLRRSLPGPRRLRDRQGHCGACLTDYTFEAMQWPDPDGRGREILAMRVVTYHQLGACRDPRDWIWQAFTSWSPTPSRNLRLARFGTAPSCPPGQVKARWDAGRAAEAAAARRQAAAQVGSGAQTDLPVVGP